MTFGFSRTPRRIAVATTAFAAVSMLAACGQPITATGTSPEATPPPSDAGSSVPGTHNTQDVKFAQMMIPHHKQAIAMAETVLANSASADVKALAKKIKQAQAPEIRTMRRWLAAWNAAATPSGSMHHGKGMMSQQQMAEFNQAEGAELNRMFLRLMIRHHQGAVAMARTELQEGQNPQAKQLAKSIIESQRAEIEQMRRMLDN